MFYLLKNTLPTPFSDISVEDKVRDKNFVN